MTPLEDRVRAAIQARASRVPPQAVPPLRLPGARRRFGSPAYGGGGRLGALLRHAWLAPAAAAVVVAALITASATATRTVEGGQARADAAWIQAAQWVAAQVSRHATVSCEPVMCQTLALHGVAPADLVELRHPAPSPLASQVIVATPAIRQELGGRLSSDYAPVVLARFGTGPGQVQVRAVARHGAATYRAALAADMRERKESGAELLASSRITVSAAARRQLLAGRVDSRLLVVIAAAAGQHPVSVTGFADSGPGASPGLPLRAVTLAFVGHRTQSIQLRSLVGFLRAQRPPYFPQVIQRLDGPPGLRIEFTAPSPLGLLSGKARSGS